MKGNLDLPALYSSVAMRLASVIITAVNVSIVYVCVVCKPTKGIH